MLNAARWSRVGTDTGVAHGSSEQDGALCELSPQTQHFICVCCRRKKWTSAGKARVPLMILALLDVLRAYPGQIPDVDAVLSVADFPCVPLCAFPALNYVSACFR